MVKKPSIILRTYPGLSHVQNILEHCSVIVGMSWIQSQHEQQTHTTRIPVLRAQLSRLCDLRGRAQERFKHGKIRASESPALGTEGGAHGLHIEQIVEMREGESSVKFLRGHIREIILAFQAGLAILASNRRQIPVRPPRSPAVASEAICWRREIPWPDREGNDCTGLQKRGLQSSAFQLSAWDRHDGRMQGSCCHESHSFFSFVLSPLFQQNWPLS